MEGEGRGCMCAFAAEALPFHSLTFFPSLRPKPTPKTDMNGKKGKLRARKYFWPKKCPILLFLSLSFPPLFPMAFLRAFYGEHDERRGGLYFPLTTPSLLFSSLFSQICTTADKTKINLFRLPTSPRFCAPCESVGRRKLA